MAGGDINVLTVRGFLKGETPSDLDGVVFDDADDVFVDCSSAFRLRMFTESRLFLSRLVTRSSLTVPSPSMTIGSPILSRIWQQENINVLVPKCVK